MAKGSIYESERIILRDARSGLRIVRLTHSPCIAQNLYFEMCSFTLDEQYVIVMSQRYAGRDAPWDLFRVRTDGAELVQLTGADDINGIVVSPESDSVYYLTENRVQRINIHSLDEVTLAEAPGRRAVAPRSFGAIDVAGKTYFANTLDESGRALLFKVDTSTGALQVIHESPWQNHITVDAAGKVVAFNDRQDGKPVPCFIESDGAHLRRQEFPFFAHNTWYGAGQQIQGTLLPPGNAIGVLTVGDPEPRKLAEGRYYWHSSPSRDAQWIVSDTNWPQEGLYLLHVPTGTVTYVCDPQSSCSHPQWTHPHPSLSPGLRYVLYNSDKTGIGQVYVAELTEEFLQQASKGYLCQPEMLR